VRVAVIGALGSTHNLKAEPFLIDAARDPDVIVAGAGIWALGELASDGSVAVLEDIASAGGEDTSNPAIAALARIDTPPAHEALSRLIDSPSVAVARAALLSVTVVDGELLAKIDSIVKSGETELLDAALEALAHAGTAAVPTLVEVARTGTLVMRQSAIGALGRIENPDAMQALRDLLEDEDLSVVRSVIAALSTMNTDEARDLLISSALSERDDIAARALEALLEMHGPEIEQALLEIAKAEPRRHEDVLRHLVTAGNKQGIAIVMSLAHSTDAQERLIAIGIFAAAGTNDGLVIALELVRAEHDAKAQALRLLASARPGEPAVIELLRDTLRTGSPDEAIAALEVLGRAGSEEAREAIVAALSNSDSEIAGAAVTAMAKFRMTPEAANALRTASESHPELAVAVMRQLFTVNSPVAVQIAERLLRTGERGDMEQALRALESAGTAEAGELLVRTARTAEPEMRAYALRSLANSGDKRAVDVVVGALRDGNASVREQAIYSLGALRSEKARDALIDFSRTGDASDRRSALLAMRDYTDARTQQRIVELSRDSDASVRYYAIDYMPDTQAGFTTLKGIASDASIDQGTRMRAANSLRYRSYLDDSTEELIESIDNSYVYSYED
jgi:HEAT repeat protein